MIVESESIRKIDNSNGTEFSASVGPRFNSAREVLYFGVQAFTGNQV